jgi:hypothetical protein
VTALANAPLAQVRWTPSLALGIPRTWPQVLPHRGLTAVPTGVPSVRNEGASRSRAGGRRNAGECRDAERE